ncbi:helix-turn-helix transcriptional regulator [Sphingosinicella sp. BN140058]|uniref:helix-turn-helix domain-containing protein n=1 Tax=Sphingosinicella sp. BN140058 TaxID=1892855 RepID=UPI001012257F|nr:helix-turn-helix transcriptional regulator [Sphingosinicella sp. BN140058]QAY78771.1 XRE family transcriptional regulator [Sphingosinicella sp. BN140058]
MTTPNQRLKIARARRFPRAIDAAKALGMPVATYNQHENGLRGSGSIPRRAAERYADFFDVSLDWLLTGRQPDTDVDDPLPTEGELEKMVEIAMLEVPAGARLADFPHIVGPALHAQLVQYRAARGARSTEGVETAPGKVARSRATTSSGARAGSRTP